MINIEIIFLFVLCFNYRTLIAGEEIEEDALQMKITNILTNNVSFGGFLFLETDGIIFPNNNLDDDTRLNLSIINDEDKKTYSLICFFANIGEIPLYLGAGKIACSINSQNIIKLGKYHLYRIEDDKSNEIYKYITIVPSLLNKSFNIIDGEEFYFYLKTPRRFEFSSETDSRTIKFFNFESSMKDEVIYLEDIPVTCQSLGFRMNCLILAKDFPQDKKFQSLNIYIKDSHGNKKRNYFAYPLYIFLDYVGKKNLKIKVTKQLTNSLTEKDFIVLETSDNTLENVIYSNTGFKLKVKNEDSNYIGELLCGFHKHPGENTKIFCNAEDGLEDGNYIFEEYISQGPLEDEDYRISSNYNVAIPSFKLNGRFIYSSNHGFDEFVFDSLFREKIYLNYKNKGEILFIALNVEHYEGNHDYYLGNSKLECFQMIKDNIFFKIPSTNFEKSGIYYFEKKNFLGERQRIYLVPPFEVIFSWD